MLKQGFEELWGGVHLHFGLLGEKLVRRKTIGWIAVTALAAGLLWASWSTPPEMVDASGVPEELWHGVGYGLFGVLLFCAFRYIEPGRPVRYAVAWALLAGLLVGGVDEWHQRVIPGRESQLWDVWWDAIGLSVGQALGLSAYLVTRGGGRDGEGGASGDSPVTLPGVGPPSSLGEDGNAGFGR